MRAIDYPSIFWAVLLGLPLLIVIWKTLPALPLLLAMYGP